MTRIAITLQYDGSYFSGWQRQLEAKSVQACLEDAISQLDPIRPVKTFAAGRTDSGVHASGQVVHFDCCGSIPVHRWPSALNGRLPNSIRVREAVVRPDSWHACYSASYRRYRYMIYNGRKPNLFLAPWSWHRYQYRLDEKLMILAIQTLIGRHDFSAFQRSGSNRKDAFTTIEEAQIERHGDLISIDIQATGFLYGMVRLLVGQLVSIGEHRLSLENFEKRWKECRRIEVKEAAPPIGLCFLRVGYEEKIFSDEGWDDSFPRFSLPKEHPPKNPP